MYNKLKRHSLHRKILFAITTIASLPILIFSLFVMIYLRVGFDFWFGSSVNKAMTQSSDIAAAYIKERCNSLRSNTLSIKAIIENYWGSITRQEFLNILLQQQAETRGLADIVVLDSSKVLGQSLFALSFAFENLQFPIAGGDEVLLIKSHDMIRATVELDVSLNSAISSNNYLIGNSGSKVFLVVRQLLDTNMSKRIEDTKTALSEYSTVSENLSSIRTNFYLVFSVVIFLLYLLLRFISSRYTRAFTAPIIELISATKKVSSGKYDQEVHTYTIDKELDDLVTNFNTMTRRLRHQSSSLISINQALKARNKFIETVLKSVPVSVVGLTPDFKITLLNDNACSLLGLSNKDLKQNIGDVFPGVKSLLFQLAKLSFMEKEVIIPSEGDWKILHVVIVRSEYISARKNMFIMIVNDITSLVKAQKKNAWSDVARRIAHEIRNPLTPIQLAVERIKYKYLDNIENAQEREKIKKYLDTIGRQVSYIGDLVGNFVNFAKMPDIILEKANISKMLSDIIFLYKQNSSAIKYNFVSSPQDIITVCDPRQIDEVFANVIKNSIEAIKDSVSKEKIISCSLALDKDKVCIIIEDSGPGFGTDRPEVLLEPYVTRKKTGIGLGLSIVGKIIEEHKGRLWLGKSDLLKGAKTLIEIPYQKE